MTRTDMARLFLIVAEVTDYMKSLQNYLFCSACAARASKIACPCAIVASCRSEGGRSGFRVIRDVIRVICVIIAF
jgi:hypothetical protein